MTGEPAGGTGRRARRAVERWVPVAAVVLALAPLALLLVKAVASGLPDFAVDGDMAVTELAVREASAGHRLLGPYSRFAFNHPGPLPFYLMVPLYLLSGESFSGLLLSALLLNAAWIAAILAAVWLAAGRLAVTWATVAVGLYLLYLGPDLLHSVWNPNLSLLPFAAAVVAAAASRGRPGFLPVAVVAASLAAQCHVAFVLPLAAVALVVVAAWFFPALLAPRHPARGTVTPPRAVWGVVLVLFAALWSPVVAEELRGSPGNLTRLARFFSSAGSGQPIAVAAGLAATAAGGPLLAPAGASAATPLAANRPAQVAAVVVSLSLVAAYLVARRRRDPFAAVLALAAGAALTAAIVAATRIVGSVEPYLVRWISVPGVLAVLAVFVAFARPRGRLSLSASAWLGLALSAALSLATVRQAAAFAPLSVHAAADRYGRIEQLAGLAAAGLARGGADAPRVGIFTHRVWDTAAGVGLHLAKAGYRVSFDPAWHEMLGRGAEGPADSALIICDPSTAETLRAQGGVGDLGGDRHAELLLVPRPEAVETVPMAAPVSVVVCSEGFYGPEAGRFRWSRGGRSVVAVPLLGDRAYQLEIVAEPVGSQDGPQVVRARLNGADLGELTMSPGLRTYRLGLPGSLVRRETRLQFDYRWVVIPGATDSRELAVRFEQLRFVPEPVGVAAGGTAPSPVGN